MPDSPEEVERQFTERLKRYKEEYDRYLCIKLRPCDCDRMSCARCLELNKCYDMLNHLRRGS
jgi:hypothetical protein